MCIHNSVQVRAPFYKCEIVCVCVHVFVCVINRLNFNLELYYDQFQINDVCIIPAYTV